MAITACIIPHSGKIVMQVLKWIILKNLWKDFRNNEGGTLIDLIMRMEDCSFHEAASKLEKKYTGMGFDAFSFHGNHQGRQQEQTTTILKV
ncbi:hypothetical protein EZS27_021143 [termite gut metagenome]|uniref:Uncharacterized protein n=1 Tax=termite gut metagenome TaxID=433724 RepID=A0A5J4R9U2_9ZZZZ